MNLLKNFDWKHGVLLAASTFGVGVWTYFQKDGVTADPMAFVVTLEHWSTAAPVVIGAALSGLSALGLMARKTWLPEIKDEVLSTQAKLPPLLPPPPAMQS